MPFSLINRCAKASRPLPDITYSPVTADDFETLAELRIAAMRESLERIGRFDPVRARERLRNSFYPEHTWLVLVDGHAAGFYTLRPTDEGLALDHLYIHPDHQGRGIGSEVMQRLIAIADGKRQPIRLNALRESDSNRFYQRHGFEQVAADEFDVYYGRHPASE